MSRVSRLHPQNCSHNMLTSQKALTLGACGEEKQKPLNPGGDCHDGQRRKCTQPRAVTVKSGSFQSI